MQEEHLNLKSPPQCKTVDHYFGLSYVLSNLSFRSYVKRNEFFFRKELRKNRKQDVSQRLRSYSHQIISIDDLIRYPAKMFIEAETE